MEQNLPRRRHQALENGVAVAADDHVLAVVATIGIGRHNAGHRGARGLADHAGAVVLGHNALQQVEDGLVQGHVHHLACTALRLAALQQRQGNAQGRVQGCNRVAETDIGPHRGVAGLAIDVAKAAKTFGDRGVAGLVGIGAGLAVAGNPRIYQPRVARLDHLRAQAPLLHGTGAKVLHQHIGAVQQLQHQLAAALTLEVQGDALLVAAQAAVPERSAVLDNAPAANRVAAGRFHLDDLGAKIRQDGAGKRPRQQLTQLDNPQTLKRSGSCCHLPTSLQNTDCTR